MKPLYKADNKYPFATEEDKKVLADNLKIDVETFSRLITACIECKLLEEKGGVLSAPRVAEELASQGKLAKKRRKAGKIGGKQSASKRQASASTESSKINYNTIHNNTIHNITNKTNKGALSSADFEFPEKLDSEFHKKALDEYIQHRKELKKPLTKIAIEKLLGKYANQPDEFLSNLNHSIANGWQGVHAPNQGNGPPGKSVDGRINTILNSLGTT